MNYAVNRSTPKKSRKKLYLLCLLLIIGYCAWTIFRPLPDFEPAKSDLIIESQTGKSTLVWPSSQSAIGFLNDGPSLQHGDNSAVATASTAKIITSLVILDKKPLNLGESGPNIPISAEEANRYNSYLAQNGSVLPVKAGEKINQLQALQAILLPSANNVSDTLAIWAFGSLDDYRAAANAYLQKHDLSTTKVGSDASGLAPDTVSNAAEMVKIGELAMANPVISNIVAQNEITGFPQVDKIANTNYLLGTDNIVGIKTGHSDQAGGAFIGAAKFKVNDQDKIVVTAVMKSTDRAKAMRESLALIRTIQSNFKPANLVKKGTVIAEYKLPWGGTIKAVTSEDLKQSVWQGEPVSSKAIVSKINTKTKSDTTVGTVSYENKSVDIKTISSVETPTIWWKLTHPFGG